MTAVTALALVLTAPPAGSDAPDVSGRVRAGLKWLAAQQNEDGSWAGTNGRLPTFATAHAGLALLMEGSTPKDGTHAPHLRKAVAWMEQNAQRDGRLGGTHP